MNEKFNTSAIERYASLLIEKIKEVNSKDWKQPWITTNFQCQPRNLEGRFYSMYNKLLLYFCTEMNGYKTPVFLTFTQAEKESLHILKGSKSFPVSYYDFTAKHKLTGEKISLEKYNLLPKSLQDDYKLNFFLKYYNVFNIDQTNFSDKYPQRWNALLSEFNNIKAIDTDGFSLSDLDAVIDNQTWVCPVHLKSQDHAYYSPTSDVIVLPLKEQFPEGKGFYHTALHEMAHSTGHTSRLNRPKHKISGDKIYAREELIAELSSALSGKSLGLNVEPQKECAQYMKSWLSALADDPKFIMSILQDVSRATAMIETTIEKNKESVESLAEENSISPEQNDKITYSSQTRTLSADVVSDGERKITTISNPMITDKLTGSTYPLDTKAIDLKELSENQIKDLLSGKQLSGISGLTGPLGLNKTPAGWCLSIGKKIVNTADSEAGI